jgi:putative endonuclease
MNRRQTGKAGEEIASKYLEKMGIKLICKNYFTKFGEIDLIGLQNRTIIFIEVKLRQNDNFGLPVEGVGLRKVDRLQNAALVFLSETNIEYEEFRFDVISIVNAGSGGLFSIEWLKNQIFD